MINGMFSGNCPSISTDPSHRHMRLKWALVAVPIGVK